MALTAAEQYLLELINRARLDPVAEAARLGVDLNQGLAAGTIRGQAQQVLAHDSRLETSAQNHSAWMLAADVFSHTGAGGSSATQRMQDAGYMFSGTWRSGENLAFSGTTGTLNLQTAITQHYVGLFESAGHRANTLNAGFSEIGIAQVSGQFTSGGKAFNASMLTENFAASRTPIYITGVAYQDRDSNRFYSMGEGRADIWISADSTRITTAAAGGYRIGVDADATTAVSLGRGSSTLATLVLDLTHGNVKLDVVTSVSGHFSLNLSGSAILVSGIGDATLLGSANLNLTGTAGYNRLIGNSGSNTLNDGGGAADLLAGLRGNDRYVVRNTDTRIVENSGQGDSDQVFAAVSFTLAADDDIEILRTASATGTQAIALTGNALGQQILGNAGANMLTGMGGADRLTGGGGADRFVFTATRDSLATLPGCDTITDMQRGLDKIDLSRIDANTVSSGFQDFSYIGTHGFSGTGAASAGQLRWQASGGGGVMVSADVNGDGRADMQILLHTVTALSWADFLW